MKASGVAALCAFSLGDHLARTLTLTLPDAMPDLMPLQMLTSETA
jgi:hypothetical protein